MVTYSLTCLLTIPPPYLTVQFGPRSSENCKAFYWWAVLARATPGYCEYRTTYISRGEEESFLSFAWLVVRIERMERFARELWWEDIDCEHAAVVGIAVWRAHGHSCMRNERAGYWEKRWRFMENWQLGGRITQFTFTSDSSLVYLCILSRWKEWLADIFG